MKIKDHSILFLNFYNISKKDIVQPTVVNLTILYLKIETLFF